MPPCPERGWSEGLVNNVAPTAPFPVSDTKSDPTFDCFFHQWAWESFIWATSINTAGGQPRFLSFATSADLGKTGAPKKGPKPLALQPRTLKPPGASVGPDDKQAGGGLVVDQNGQVVWYSVHMNDTYAQFVQKYGGTATARRNPT